MPELTAHQSCSEVKDLWTGIALEAQKGKHRSKREIPGPWESYRCRCPCCEYVGAGHLNTINCSKCPMKQEWKSFDPLDWDNPAEDYFCEKYITPYLKWSDGPKHYTCYDLAFFAWLIVELAEEAMERIKKEEDTL